MSHENTDYIQARRAKGYRVTPQRLIVLDAVCAQQGYATINDILLQVNEMDSTIDRSTIYRALDVLREVGLIVESNIDPIGKVYRIAGDTDHHHLVCLSCGQVLTVNQQTIETLAQFIDNEYGFEMQAEHLVFNGLCKACR